MVLLLRTETEEARWNLLVVLCIVRLVARMCDARCVAAGRGGGVQRVRGLAEKEVAAGGQERAVSMTNRGDV